jgi:hypothetical protein
MVNTTIYVDPNVPDDSGDGSIDSPFKSLATAIGRVPPFPPKPGAPGQLDTSVSATIMLARGNYDPNGQGLAGAIRYTDKRITFVGQALLNQSPDPPTHGVWLAPSFTDGGAYVEVERLNCAISPQTYNAVIICRDAYVEAWGSCNPLFLLSGTPLTARMGAKIIGPGPVGTIIGEDAGITACYVGAAVELTSCALNGGVLELANGNGASLLSGCVFNNTGVKTAHALTLNSCIFNTAVTFATTGSGSVITDMISYARGLRAGCNFPAATIIVDPNGTELQPPALVAAGAGVNSTGDLALGYPSNAPGDLFIAQVNCAGASVPVTPAGWTLQFSKANAGITEYVYTRNARSTGGETGTVTWSTATENAPHQGVVYSFRNVAASAYIESETDFISTDGTGHGPTVTPLGPGRLACVFFSSNYDGPKAEPIAGNTGGTWQVRFNHYSGIGALIQLQTAALAANTAVSGGSCSLGGDSFKVAGIAFALIGAAA